MQGQPGYQQGFAVQHYNPYAQQPQAYQPQPQAYQPQAYQPPAQYGAPVVVVVGGQQPDPTDHASVNQIDQHLSSGCYSCYNCWLYLMAIFGGLTALTIFNGKENIGLFIWGIASLRYATIMIEALRNKDAKGASSGVYYGFFVAICNGIALYSRSLYAGSHGNSDEAQTILYGIGPGLVIDIFIVILPAIKIKGHLERRTALLLGTHTV